MIRAVFDSVVVLRAYINPQSRWGQLLAQHARTYRLVLSPDILAEYLDVLQRPELVRRFDRLQQLDMFSVLQELASADIVAPEEISPVSRDPKDDKFLATAKAGDASYIVSEDNDLLVLGEYEGVRIVAAAAFLDILESAAH